MGQYDQWERSEGYKSSKQNIFSSKKASQSVSYLHRFKKYYIITNNVQISSQYYKEQRFYEVAWS